MRRGVRITGAIRITEERSMVLGRGFIVRTGLFAIPGLSPGGLPIGVILIGVMLIGVMLIGVIPIIFSFLSFSRSLFCRAGFMAILIFCLRFLRI